MSWNNVKISKTLEHNISHPRKAAATKKAALSDLDFSGRGELNKYLCNSAKIKSAQVDGSFMGIEGYMVTSNAST